MRSAFLLGMSLVGCGTAQGTPGSSGRSTCVGDAGGAATPRLLCNFNVPEPSPRVALAVAIDGDIVFVMTDGSTRTPYHFQPAVPGPGGPSFDTGIDQSGGYVVAHATWWGPPQGGTIASACTLRNGLAVCPEDDRVVLLDLAGHVLWEKSFSGPTASSNGGVSARVGDGGYVLVSRSLEKSLNASPATSTLVQLLIAPDGSQQPLPAVTPFDRSFTGPAVPVVADLTKQVFGW